MKSEPVKQSGFSESPRPIVAPGWDSLPASPDVAHLAARGPTTAELALVAASLSDRSRDWSVLAGDALALWRACEEELKKHRHRNQKFLEIEDELPKPKTYPVSLDEFLKLTVHQKRSADRMRAYRRFLMCWLNLASNEEAGDMLAGHRKVAMAESEYEYRAFLFMVWLRTDHSATKRGNARSAKLSGEEIKDSKKEASVQCKQILEQAIAEYNARQLKEFSARVRKFIW